MKEIQCASLNSVAKDYDLPFDLVLHIYNMCLLRNKDFHTELELEISNRRK